MNFSSFSAASDVPDEIPYQRFPRIPWGKVLAAVAVLAFVVFGVSKVVEHRRSASTTACFSAAMDADGARTAAQRRAAEAFLTNHCY